MTQTAPPANWQQGWGFEFTSPTGDVNNATQTRSNGTTYNVVHNWDGTLSYVPVTAAPGTTSPTPSTSADSSAKAIIDGALGQYGLQSLSSWAWSKWQAGETIDQIMLELRSTPEYQTRFPAMDTLSKAGHAISESEYINLEQTYTQIGRQYGLPSGFYDQPSDFTALISGEVSPAEFQQRVQDYATFAFEVDPTTRDQLQRLYGVDAGHLAAFFIDPDKALPVLQRQFGATQAAAAASRAAFGNLDQTQAESLANISPEALAQGFGTLYQNRELFNTLPGEAGSGISTNAQLGAAFLGDAASQQSIDTAARRRKAVFDQGGTVAQTQQGFAGAG